MALKQISIDPQKPITKPNYTATGISVLNVTLPRSEHFKVLP